MKNQTVITEKDGALQTLRKMLKPKTTVFTLLRHQSASGMSRVIDLYIIEKNRPVGIAWLVAKALGLKCDKNHDGLRVGDCGMDMGFDLVYELGAALWPNGTDKPHGTRNGVPDKAGGYALNHEWI